MVVDDEGEVVEPRARGFDADEVQKIPLAGEEGTEERSLGVATRGDRTQDSAGTCCLLRTLTGSLRPQP